jgi:hypothetical protein
MACRTCDLIQGLLMAKGVPAPIAVATTPIIEAGEKAIEKKVKRKASEYSKRYGRAFKKIQNDFKKKDGCWKKGGFKRCAAEARKIARGKK